METMFHLKSTKALFILLVLVNSLSTGILARPLSLPVTAGDDVGFFDWLSLGGIKSSGPSGGGEGHKFTNSDTVGGIKTSGPSGPGAGH